LYYNTIGYSRLASWKCEFKKMGKVKHISIRVSGQVQGVFFRDSARRQAKKLGLKGFARNEPDGSVYIEAEGDKEALEKFLEWCKKGTMFAKVEKVDFEFSEAISGFPDFEIR